MILKSSFGRILMLNRNLRQHKHPMAATYGRYPLNRRAMESSTSRGDSMHATAMCWAAAEGNIETMRRLLEEHGADVNAADYDKRTPLHIAVSNEQLEMASYLLQCGANAETLDRWGRSSIDCAIGTKNLAILGLLGRETCGQSGTLSLFEDGQRLRSTSESMGTRRNQSSPDVASFFHAIKEGNTEKVKRSWLDGMEVNVVDHLGRTSLHVAVENDQIGVIELLLSAGVNATVVDTFGRSPISIALEKQHVAIVEMLRSHQKMKLLSHRVTSNEDEHKVALAFQSTKRGELERLKQLVPAFVRPDMDNYDHRTLLHVASAEGHLQIVKYLVHSGANVNSLDRYGSSPLSDAVDFAHNEVAKFLSANHAMECGFQATVAVDHIDNATLAGAIEYTLRVVTRESWIMGQAHCPMRDQDNKCILMTHRIWQKNPSAVHAQRQSTEPRARQAGPIKRAAVPRDGLQTFRKVSSMVMMDPGQGHIGSVFSGQHVEWLDLHAAPQSHFFLLPHARVAGFQTSLAVPMICKLSTVAVLSWYSISAMREDAHEVQRIQRLVRSVMILSSLRQELQSAGHATGPAGRIPRFQYCQTLDAAITANGELTDTSIGRKELNMCDTIPLALEWGLFDLVDTLATSMSSEDHAAVVPILRSLVVFLCNGLFDATLRRGCLKSHDSSLKHVIEDSNGRVRTTWALMGHLQYYLQYLTTVSPTECELFADVCALFRKVENYLHERAPEDMTVKRDSETTLEMKRKAKAAATERASGPDCVLCKYRVPGHKHPGQSMTRVPASAAPGCLNPSSGVQGPRLFGHATDAKSPVYRQLEELLARLEGEYDAFARKPELATCTDGLQGAVVTSSDLYDVIGAAHEPMESGKAVRHNARQALLDVIQAMVHDTSSVLSRKHLFALHERLLVASSGHAGVLRTDVAVGFASPRIYRVFLPAGEIDDALNKYIERLNETRRWERRPLLCAYYAFAALVFYIHPFYDGNGRCARLVGNVVAKKLGFPFLLRAGDKTMQVGEFLQKAIVSVTMRRSSRRQTRQTRVLTTRKENASMWF